MQLPVHACESQAKLVRLVAKRLGTFLSQLVEQGDRVVVLSLRQRQIRPREIQFLGVHVGDVVVILLQRRRNEPSQFGMLLG